MITFKEFLTESSASTQAKMMGLSHYGYGRFGKNGATSHVSKHGRLVPIHKTKEFSTLQGEQLKHLEHLDDEPFNNGIEGVTNAIDHIQAIRHGSDRVKVGTKFDGSPSLTIGRDANGRHWVSTKSAFNASPKINYTEEDIDKNHGHAPGLVKKLKAVLPHIHKLGLKHGQTIQADLMFDQEDKKDEGDRYTFKPNTIKYGVNKTSNEGKKIEKAKIGLAIHTEYHAGVAEINPDIKTADHPDIYKAPVKVDTSKVNFDRQKLKHHESEIGRLTKSLSKDDWEAVQHAKVRDHLRTYVNSKIRKGETDYNVDELLDHIKSKTQKDIDAVKTEKSKANKTAAQQELLDHVNKNRHAYKTTFAIQTHINDAKNHIVKKLDDHQKGMFDHEYANGDQANPEGYVSTGHHGPIKFVNRLQFSRANFLQSANR